MPRGRQLLPLGRCEGTHPIGLRGRGILHRIARKGVESSTRLGRHRWTIERTMSWLAGCRRLHRRYERKAEHFLAFTSIACTPTSPGPSRPRRKASGWTTPRLQDHLTVDERPLNDA